MITSILQIRKLKFRDLKYLAKAALAKRHRARFCSGPCAALRAGSCGRAARLGARWGGNPENEDGPDFALPVPPYRDVGSTGCSRQELRQD